MICPEAMELTSIPPHHRQHLQAGRGRACTIHNLQKERQIGHRAEQREPDDEPDSGGGHKGGVAEQAQRENRLRGAVLYHQKRGQPEHGRGAERENRHRSPRVGGAAEVGQQHHGTQQHREQSRTGEIDGVPHPVTRAWQRDCNHRQRKRSQGKVDVEDPAPGKVCGEVPAQERPRHAGNAEHRAENALVLAPFARRNDVAHYSLRGDHYAAATQPLHRAEQNQLHHVAAQPAEHGTQQEDADAGLQHDFPAVQVAELAVQRGDNGLREQVRGDDPGKALQPAEIPHNRGQRGCDNGGI